jgi:hypothetical protein
MCIQFSVTNVEGDVPGNSAVEKTKFVKRYSNSSLLGIALCLVHPAAGCACSICSELVADIGGSRWRTLDFW